MPIEYGPSTPMNNDIPEDLLMAANEADAMIGDELASLMPPFEKPINVKVLDALAKATASVAKVMGMDVVPEKYTEPTTELDPDLVRFLAMIEAAATDYGVSLPVPLSEIRDEAGLTSLTAFLTELARDKDFKEFLDMPAPEEEGEVEISVEAPMPGGGEEFDFASRMSR